MEHFQIYGNSHIFVQSIRIAKKLGAKLLPCFLLSMFGNVFEKSIFKCLFQFSEDEKFYLIINEVFDQMFLQQANFHLFCTTYMLLLRLLFCFIKCFADDTLLFSKTSKISANELINDLKTIFWAHKWKFVL